jgi:hypothetical protein
MHSIDSHPIGLVNAVLKRKEIQSRLKDETTQSNQEILSMVLQRAKWGSVCLSINNMPFVGLSV